MRLELAPAERCGCHYCYRHRHIALVLDGDDDGDDNNNDDDDGGDESCLSGSYDRDPFPLLSYTST